MPWATQAVKDLGHRCWTSTAMTKSTVVRVPHTVARGPGRPALTLPTVSGGSTASLGTSTDSTLHLSGGTPNQCAHGCTPCTALVILHTARPQSHASSAPEVARACTTLASAWMAVPEALVVVASTSTLQVSSTCRCPHGSVPMADEVWQRIRPKVWQWHANPCDSFVLT